MKNQKLSEICKRIFIKSISVFMILMLTLIVLGVPSLTTPSEKALAGSIVEDEEIENTTNDDEIDIKNDDVNLFRIKYNMGNINNVDIIVNEDTNEEFIDNVLLLSNYEEGEALPKITYSLEKTGYVSTALNVREYPNTDCKVLDVLKVNTKVRYSIYSDNWVVIKRNGNYVYLCKKYIKDKPVKINKYIRKKDDVGNVKYITKTVMGDRRKSYMDYRCITSRNSRQYRLQAKYGYTGSNGVRMVNGRYCIALGSYYTHNIGQYVDLILGNGTVIKCIVADAKSNRHTNSNNSVGRDGSVAEFVVDTPRLSSSVKRMGDISYATNGWKSNVVKVKIYNKNIF